MKTHPKVLRIDPLPNNCVRIVAFDVDEETGARSATDIFEIEKTPRAARVIIDCLGGDPWLFDGAQAQNFDFGRTWSPAGMLQRAIDQTKE